MRAALCAASDDVAGLKEEYHYVYIYLILLTMKLHFLRYSLLKLSYYKHFLVFFFIDCLLWVVRSPMRGWYYGGSEVICIRREGLIKHIHFHPKMRLWAYPQQCNAEIKMRRITCIMDRRYFLSILPSFLSSYHCNSTTYRKSIVRFHGKCIM